MRDHGNAEREGRREGGGGSSRLNPRATLRWIRVTNVPERSASSENAAINGESEERKAINRECEILRDKSQGHFTGRYKNLVNPQRKRETGCACLTGRRETVLHSSCLSFGALRAFPTALGLTPPPRLRAVSRFPSIRGVLTYAGQS